MNPNRFLIPVFAAALALVLAGAPPAVARERIDLDDPAARADEYPNVHWYPPNCYIPGYGMSDPDYIYAHTDTVSVKTVSQAWSEEPLALAAGAPFSGTAAVAFLPELRGRVDAYEEKPEKLFEIVQFDTVPVRLVSFRARKAERFEGFRLYTILRAQFELWRAKRDYIFMPKWERCGESYTLFDRPEAARLLRSFEKP